jgi:hypothetical protein
VWGHALHVARQSEKIPLRISSSTRSSFSCHVGAAITVVSASPGCDGFGRADMTVRTKLERNKMSRGYTLLWSENPCAGTNTSEWNGIVGETRESLNWAQALLRCWSKRKNGLNAALNEHPDIRGTWSSSLVAGRSQVTGLALFACRPITHCVFSLRAVQACSRQR